MSATTSPGARRGRLALACVVLVAGAGCGRGRGAQLSLQTPEHAVGHATLQLSGAVNGVLDADVEVSCFGGQGGDPFQVSIDADEALATGDRPFLSLDFSTPSYRGPRTYDLARALASDEEFDTGDFLLLFKGSEETPYGWGGAGGRGTITIDRGGTSGRIQLPGWESSRGRTVDLAGTFRCGRKPG